MDEKKRGRVSPASVLDCLDSCTIESPRLALRPYQLEALDAIAEAERRGVRRPLVALPTGTGKTVIFAHLIAGRPGRALILAHRDELLRQARDKLCMVMPGTDIGLIKAGVDETGERPDRASSPPPGAPRKPSGRLLDRGGRC